MLHRSGEVQETSRSDQENHGDGLITGGKSSGQNSKAVISLEELKIVGGTPRCSWEVTNKT